MYHNYFAYKKGDKQVKIYADLETCRKDNPGKDYFAIQGNIISRVIGLYDKLKDFKNENKELKKYETEL